MANVPGRQMSRSGKCLRAANVPFNHPNKFISGRQMSQKGKCLKMAKITKAFVSGRHWSLSGIWYFTKLKSGKNHSGKKVQRQMSLKGKRERGKFPKMSKKAIVL
jgi:hypothetical protein